MIWQSRHFKRQTVPPKLANVETKIQLSSFYLSTASDIGKPSLITIGSELEFCTHGTLAWGSPNLPLVYPDAELRIIGPFDDPEGVLGIVFYFGGLEELSVVFSQIMHLSCGWWVEWALDALDYWQYGSCSVVFSKVSFTRQPSFAVLQLHHHMIVVSPHGFVHFLATNPLFNDCVTNVRRMENGIGKWISVSELV